ncbi:DUF2802 domain-containing protein [Alteromonas sp. ASW11-19]|uniref:DUF2802 domain-containing protein n=1 Tax=Alteromonas salexigens TaxID=2982530 RepID=A0ABT2VRK6_9ALTE|nr:DUF2802 domain-containing protein [Alteromonas salexigens]MCU7555043.1 DUF2802 domain-containing protein [Alteromonas salexigens]
MLAFSTENLIITALVIVPFVVLFILVLLQRRQLAQLRAALAQQQTELSQLTTDIKQVVNQQHEDQARTVVVTRHIQGLQEQHTQLENQLRDVKLQDPSMRLYQRAADMARQGASLEEIMQACDIPPAEAELLISMHTKHA